MRSLSSGSTRATTSRLDRPVAPSTFVVGRELRADRAPACRRRDSPTSSAMAARGGRVVTGDHRHADAGAPAGGDGSRPRRLAADPRRPAARRGEVRLDRVGVCAQARVGERPRGRRPGPATRCGRSAPRHRCRAGDVAAARQHGVGCTLQRQGADRGRPTCAVAAGRTGSRVVAASEDPRRRAGGPGRRWRPPSGRRRRSTRPSGRAVHPAVGATSSDRRDDPTMAARDGCGSSSGDASGRSRRRRSIGTSPCGVHTVTTVISLRVSVPVLSVQMNVVEPSVSTASRWRTRAWWSAMRWAPMASDSVTVGQQALGDEGDHHADAEEEPVARRHADQQREREEADADADGDEGDDANQPVQLERQRGRGGGRPVGSAPRCRPGPCAHPSP